TLRVTAAALREQHGRKGDTVHGRSTPPARSRPARDRRRDPRSSRARPRASIRRVGWAARSDGILWAPFRQSPARTVRKRYDAHACAGHATAPAARRCVPVLTDGCIWRAQQRTERGLRQKWTRRNSTDDARWLPKNHCWGWASAVA